MFEKKKFSSLYRKQEVTKPEIGSIENLTFIFFWKCATYGDILWKNLRWVIFVPSWFVLSLGVWTNPLGAHDSQQQIFTVKYFESNRHCCTQEVKNNCKERYSMLGTSLIDSNPLDFARLTGNRLVVSWEGNLLDLRC